MASVVWMPPDRGSPAGPNQWLAGAPVVRPLRPTYVVPLTDRASTVDTKCVSSETMAPVRWCRIRSIALSTSSSWSSRYSVTTCSGPNTSVVAASKFSGEASICSSGTKTAVGANVPYCCGTECAVATGAPPKSTSAPGILSSRSMWLVMDSFVTDSVGEMVRSSSVRSAASWAMRSMKPAWAQFECINTMLWAEHFWPEKAYASWSLCHAANSSSRTSGPRIFQSNPASSSLIRPSISRHSFSAMCCDPVKRSIRGADRRSSAFATIPSEYNRSMSSAGIPHSMSIRTNCSITIETFSSTLSIGRFPMKRADSVCSAGISSGKLNGVMTATGPYGHRYPRDSCPKWSPGTANDRARLRTPSPPNVASHLWVVRTSPRHCSMCLGATRWIICAKYISTSGSAIAAAALEATLP
mmetsp:Transcript_24500/g.63877  ORF Transcript_24500/g.63877 Transcript_24500/m.63877 type:complete len:413 (-) Transcript_24500:583-1821(-)